MQGIQFCPELHPTDSQFSDFYSYVQRIEKQYKSSYGLVKIVPPQGWKSKINNYEHILNQLVIKRAIEQNVQGFNGFYQCKNILQPSLTFKSFKKYSLKENQKVNGKTTAEKEKIFWKTITYSPGTYAADLSCSLMDNESGSWNQNSLHSLLSYGLKQKIRGVNQPYCYIGAWKTLFCWHVEDLDLSALNLLHEGDPKVWYAIQHQDSHILETIAKQHFREKYRHKSTLINPYLIKSQHPDLRIHKVQHKENQIVIVFGGAYHCGFNCGFNVAEAINYATPDWMSKLTTFTPCQCSKHSVQADPQQILYNLTTSIIKDDIVSLPQYEQLNLYVEEINQEKQNKRKNMNQDDIKKLIIKTIKQKTIEKKKNQKKKIKKLKLLQKLKKTPKKNAIQTQEQISDENQMMYLNDIDLQIELKRSVMCDKCNKWRVVDDKIIERFKDTSFSCENINKECYQAYAEEKENEDEIEI